MNFCYIYFLKSVLLQLGWVAPESSWLCPGQLLVRFLVPSRVSVAFKSFHPLLLQHFVYGSCGNQPCVTSQGSLRPLTGAFRQSGLSRTQINRALRRSGVNWPEVTRHWTCFFCSEFFSCQCKKQRTNKHMVPHNRLLSILSCNPHFSLTASFTEHTRGGERKKHNKRQTQREKKNLYKIPKQEDKSK